jgi:hypothetical protein
MATSGRLIEFPLEFQYWPRESSPSLRERVGLASQTYVLEPAARTQRRLAGRLQLSPKLDLSAYRARAVVDWVRVRVETDGPVHAGALYRRLTRDLGVGISRVEGPNGEWGHTGRAFLVKFDDPDPERLPLSVACIDAAEGLACTGALESVEVSVDLYPKRPRGETARVLMTDLVRRHIRPADEIWRRGQGWPR